FESGVRMNILRPVPATIVFAAASLFAMGWLAGGCASGKTSQPSSSSAPKPGSGIVEYRALTHDAHRAVAATVKLLEALAQPASPTSATHPALPQFDRTLHQLELTSIKTRARAEAIIARGQAYFDEWKGNLGGITNQATVRAETESYDRLQQHFERVRQRSSEVREEFRPFMAKLREFRARLDSFPNPTDGELSRTGLAALTATGRRVMQTLDAVSAELDAAETELRATLASK
ncbi:MAG TPA: hypothetical protein VGF13_16130, partial [Verrucomicrobiae bacterium]